jgi:hypothetical protein
MGLCAFKVRVAADCLGKVACKIILDSSGSIDLIGCDNGQLLPVSVQKVGADPICVFVDSRSFRLNFRRQLSFFSSLA